MSKISKSTADMELYEIIVLFLNDHWPNLDFCCLNFCIGLGLES